LYYINSRRNYSTVEGERKEGGGGRKKGVKPTKGAEGSGLSIRVRGRSTWFASMTLAATKKRNEEKRR